MKKILSMVVLVIVLTNMILFAFRKINSVMFWSIIVLCAIFAYVVLPKLKQ